MQPIRIAVVAASVLALTACGGGGESKPATTGQPPAGQPSAAAPKTSAPAQTTAAQQAPTSSLDELALSGQAAGMDFKVMGAEDKKKGAGMTDMVKNMKIEPAECQQVMNSALSAQDPSAGASVATNDAGSAYAVGVSKSQSSTKQVKSIYGKCGTMTMDMGGMKVQAKTTVADDTAQGASEVLSLSTATELAGRSSTNYQKVGIVRGLYVQAMGLGEGVDKANVDKVFQAQVDKISKAK